MCAVFVIDLTFLPFPSVVDWAEISISVPAQALLEYQARLNDPATVNPLLFLQAIERDEPERIDRMRRGLARARWHLLYHQAGRGVPVPGAAQRPSAGHALVRELERAAAKRLQLARAAPGKPDAVLQCTRREDPDHLPNPLLPQRP